MFCFSSISEFDIVSNGVSGSEKVGITGFCMGGALAMGGLAASAEIACGAPFYGVTWILTSSFFRFEP